MVTAFGQHHVTGGFLGRNLFICPGEMERGERQRVAPDVPPVIAKHAKDIIEFTRDVVSGVPVVVKLEGKPQKIIETFADEMAEKARRLDDDTAAAFLNRAEENTKKVACILAISENHKKPKVSVVIAEWSVGFVQQSLNYAVHELHGMMSKSKTEKLQDKVLQYIGNAQELAGHKRFKGDKNKVAREEMENGYLPRWILMQYMGLTKQHLNIVIDTLKDSRLIEEFNEENGTFYACL